MDGLLSQFGQQGRRWCGPRRLINPKADGVAVCAIARTWLRIRGGHNVPGVSLTDHGKLIATYALCGFANFSSIAIQMAVTGGLAPNQRPVIARLGLKALAAGSLSNLMSAALAGLFLSL